VTITLKFTALISFSGWLWTVLWIGGMTIEGREEMLSCLMRNDAKSSAFREYTTGYQSKCKHAARK
jgi:hypothetical protein